MVNGLAEDTEGAIWAVTWGEGVHRIQGTEITTYTEEDGLPDDWVRSVSAASDGGVWIGTGEGIARIRDGRVQVLTRENFPLLNHGEVIYIREFSDGRVWVGTWDGEVLVREPSIGDSTALAEGWRRVATAEDTGGSQIYQMLETGPEEMLVAMRDRGLARIRNGRWVTETTVGSEDPFSLFKKGNGDRGQVWVVARYRSDSYRYDGGIWSPLASAPPLATDITAGPLSRTHSAIPGWCPMARREDWTNSRHAKTVGRDPPGGKSGRPPVPCLDRKSGARHERRRRSL
jgi:hypothetical protein